MHSPEISVIVPVYNAERYLHRCVDSILTQTDTNFELLLINDGSKDSSGAICDEYAAIDSRVRVFHKPNGGVSSARNIGLDNAQGKWIVFADADDYCLPHWIANFNFQSYGSRYDLINQGMQSDKPLDESLDDLQQKYYVDYSGDIIQLLELLYDAHILGFLQLKAFRKKIIDCYDIRFNEKIKIQEDETFVLSYSKYCKYGISIPESGYFYCVPNWAVKYKTYLTNSIYLPVIESIFRLVDENSVRRSSKLYKDKLYVLTNCLYENLRDNGGKVYLLGLRRVVVSHFKECPMNLCSKIGLYIDPTCSIARVWFNIIFRFRR